MLVSVITPCRNEANFISGFVENVFAQVLSGIEIELLVADGRSDDGTRDQLDRLADLYPRLCWLDNPIGIVSTGLNLCIHKAAGMYIVRMDVHTYYQKDYIQQCVNALLSTDALCVGGPWLAQGTNPRQCAIAAAFQSRIGSGGASSRLSWYSGYVDTVYLGAWRRNDLLMLGGFDEGLVRNQDDELCLRIRRKGGRIWQSSAIRSVYYPRSSLLALYRQFSQYGYWKIPVIRKYRIPASPRHLAPFFFFLFISLLLVLIPFWHFAAFVLFVALLLYLLSVFIVAISARARLNSISLGCITVAAVVVMHSAYAIGFARAVIDFFFLRVKPRDSMARLTRF